MNDDRVFVRARAAVSTQETPWPVILPVGAAGSEAGKWRPREVGREGYSARPDGIAEVRGPLANVHSDNADLGLVHMAVLGRGPDQRSRRIWWSARLRYPARLPSNQLGPRSIGGRHALGRIGSLHPGRRPRIEHLPELGKQG